MADLADYHHQLALWYYSSLPYRSLYPSLSPSSVTDEHLRLVDTTLIKARCPGVFATQSFGLRSRELPLAPIFSQAVKRYAIDLGISQRMWFTAAAAPEVKVRKLRNRMNFIIKMCCDWLSAKSAFQNN